jgi:hypothetical protein
MSARAVKEMLYGVDNERDKDREVEKGPDRGSKKRKRNIPYGDKLVAPTKMRRQRTGRCVQAMVVLLRERIRARNYEGAAATLSVLLRFYNLYPDDFLKCAVRVLKETLEPGDAPY